MPDIGLGLADRRTVVVILAAVLVATQFFGGTPPINPEKVSLQAIFELALIAGYFYAVRNLTRSVLGTFFAIRDGYAEFRGSRVCGRQDCNRCIRVSLFRRTGRSIREFALYYFTRGKFSFGGKTGIVERLLLIPLTLTLVVPELTLIWKTVGMVGLGICAVLWVARDDFSFMVEDGVAKEKREKIEIAEISKARDDVYVRNMPVSLRD